MESPFHNPSKAEFCEQLGADALNEVRIVDMKVSADDGRYILIDESGRNYKEVCTNQFVDLDGSHDLRFLGTGRHQGGIVLRPLYGRIDGLWYNISTGKPAPDWMQSNDKSL